MIRRTFDRCMAGALRSSPPRCSAPAPAVAQGKKIVIAAPGIPPIFASTIALRRREAGLLQEVRRRRRGAAVRHRHRGRARGDRGRHRHVAVADAAAHQPDLQRRRAAVVGDLRHAESRLGARHDRYGARPLQGHRRARPSASTRSAARARSRCASMLAAAAGREDRRCAAGRARLERRPGDDRRPAEVRRAASRRRRRSIEPQGKKVTIVARP